MRTYGNWKRPTSPGLLGLGMVATFGLLIALVFMVVLMTITNLLVGLAFGLAIAVVTVVLSLRDRHGLSIGNRLAQRFSFAYTRASRANLYRSGPLGRTPWGTHQLPGVAATTQLSEHEDSYGRPFALIHAPKVKTFTVVLASDPDGGALVDQDTVDFRVAAWGDWLAGLADEPGLVGAAVTVESAPETGQRLAQAVQGRMDSNAPTYSRAVLEEVVQDYPSGSSTVRAYVSLTFQSDAMVLGRTLNPEEMGRELATRLPGLTSSLGLTGAGACLPATAAELCEVVQVAYNPVVARYFDEARAEGEVPDISWSEVGPSAHESAWGHYRHDSAVSVTWSMTGAPRGVVQSSILRSLLSPHRDIARKRVTMLYQPIDAARAARMVERDESNSVFAATAARRTTHRQAHAVQSARATAAEEASGAGLVGFGMLVTATVTEPEKLPAAKAAVEHLGGAARLQLRPVYGSQHAAFAFALPLGLVPEKHSNVPTVVREGV
ncbi:SCO6880 family protein [Litorihabitans aurantiacus]|uniref:Integral membrane protein n=1 Tax=Litorihabitans aurantiacus TaxID=1930061 RepID=A0AA37XI40_9MICO|nr:hypothetical protein GCM10025875_36460 [Litorihabitans aurantiacus]GMA33722.1 hypothetical protein GCM10025875_37140 [Litorihabitans aurantiacus]GMA33786.1 hypothetical protein GCM10025875_37780 [Litorihabitans aurantiacus]